VRIACEEHFAACETGGQLVAQREMIVDVGLLFSGQ